MARIPMVTRTMKSTVCEVMAVDTVEAEIHNITVTVPRTYKDEKSLEKAVKSTPEFSGETALKFVQVVSAEVVEQLYAMSEADFLRYAKPVEKADTKEYSSEVEPENDTNA